MKDNGHILHSRLVLCSLCDSYVNGGQHGACALLKDLEGQPSQALFTQRLWTGDCPAGIWQDAEASENDE